MKLPIIRLFLVAMASCIGICISHAQTVDTNGLIAWWDLDETAGTRFDSHAGHTATDATSVGVVDFQGRNAASFVAANSQELIVADDDALDIGNGGQEWTIHFWLYYDTTNAGSQILDKGSDYDFLLTSAGRVQFRAGMNSEVMSADSWNWVSAGFDGTNTWLSINNGSPAIVSGSLNGASNANPLQIGDGYAGFLQGGLARLGIWKRTLSQEELDTIYNSGNDSTYQNLVDTSQYIALDGSGNYISTPDSPENSVESELSIIVKAALDDWAATGNQVLLNKNAESGDQRSWFLRITSAGKPRFIRSETGATTSNSVADIAPPFTDGEPYWIRVDFVSDNGSGSAETTFYYATVLGYPSSNDWIQLGSTETTSSITGLFDSSAPIIVGGYDEGDTNKPSGKFYYAEVRDRIDGNVVARFNASEGDGTNFPNVSGQTDWTNHGGTPGSDLAATDSANLVAWYTADAGVYSDAGVTLLDSSAEDATTVQQWNDQSGNGNHLDETDSIKKPAFKWNDQNGLPGIEFDGVNDFLDLDATLLASSPITVYVAAKRATNSADHTVVSFVNKSNNIHLYHLRLLGDSNGNNLQWRSRDGGSSALANTTSEVLPDSVHLLVGQEASQSDRSAWMDGGNKGANTETRSPTGIDNFGLGANVDTSPDGNFHGTLYEVRVYSVAHDNITRALVETEMNAKWAINQISYIVHDTFDEASGTPLENHTSNSGHTWSGIETVHFDVEAGNGLLTIDNANSEYAATDAVAPNANYAVTVKGTTSSTTSSRVGAFAKYIDSANRLQLYLHNDGLFTLDKKVNDVWQNIGSKTISPFDPNSEYEIKLVADGTNVEAYLDGNLELSGTQAELTAVGRFGVLMAGTDARVNEFFAEDLGASPTVPVTSITIDQTDFSLDIGAASQLTATISPVNATNQDVSWDSDAPAVVGVDANGLVTAVAQGTADITATAEAQTDSITVTVNPPPNQPPVADAGNDQSTTDNDDNGVETVTLDGSGSTDDSGITNYSWSEGGSQIATGVTPQVSLGVGTHTITLTVTDADSETDTDTVSVTVNAALPPAGGPADGPLYLNNSTTGSDTSSDGSRIDLSGTDLIIENREADSFIRVLNAGSERFVIDPSGNFGLGTQILDYKLNVAGTIRAEEVIVETGWSDFVFDPGYNLPTLDDVELHIRDKGHLPGVPSAEAIQSEGLSIGQSQALLMQKIEELTLYILEQEKRIQNLEEQLNELKND